MSLSKRFRLLVLVPFLLVISSCSFNLLPDADFFEEEVSSSFKKILSAIGDKNESELTRLSTPEMTSIENYEELISQIFSLTGDTSLAEQVAAEYRKSDNSAEAHQVYYAVYEYKNEKNYDLLELALEESEGECCFLRHINLRKNEFRSATYHDFKSQELSFIRVFFMFLMISTLLFTLVSALFVVRDKNLKLKWLWFLFVLFGTYGLTLNWTTGNIAANFISYINGTLRFSFIKINLLGVGFERSGIFQPWILNWGFPLGATIYSTKRIIGKKKI